MASLSHLQYRSTEFLLAFAPLNAQSVLDYFTLSPFYDKSCNNAVLRMQMMFSRGGMQGIDEEAELRRFAGIEYAVVHAAPPLLFIIHKRERKSPDLTTPLAAYYVLNDNIYQGPTLYSVVNERLLTSLHALSTSLGLIRDNRPAWTAEKLWAWDIKQDVVEALPEGAQEGEQEQEADQDKEVLSSKREREEELGEGETKDDDEKERPANSFNPLLFRALQSLATSLAPAAAPPPVDAIVLKPEVKSERSATPASTVDGEESKKRKLI